MFVESGDACDHKKNPDSEDRKADRFKGGQLFYSIVLTSFSTDFVGVW